MHGSIGAARDAENPMTPPFQFLGSQFRLWRRLRKSVNHGKGSLDDAKRFAVVIDNECFRHLGGRIEWHKLGNSWNVSVRFAQGSGSAHCGVDAILATVGAGERRKRQYLIVTEAGHRALSGHSEF